MRNRLGSTLGLALLFLPSLAAAEPTVDRQETLVHRLKHDCGSCHGMTLKGGLGPPLLPADLAGKPDDALVDIILNGIPGTPMPPWRGELENNEAVWLVTRLKEGVSGDD